MNKKLLMLLAAGALVVTGCATKEATKNNDNSNSNNNTNTTNSSNDNKTTTTTSTTSQTSNETTQNQQTANHNLEEAKKLADIVAVSGNNLGTLKTQTNMLAWITQDRVAKKTADNGEVLFTISKEDYLDVINEFSNKTYTMDEALNLIKGENFNEYEVSSDKSPLIPTNNEIHYYKGDDKIVFEGLLYDDFPQEVESPDKWKVNDDTISINVLDEMTKMKFYTVVLKLNNKNYQGGREKSVYYVAEIK